MRADQLRDLIIVPVLKHLGMYSEAAANLVLGTAIQESGLHHLVQMGGGPARGIFQMEPATHDDLWLNYLSYRPALVQKINDLELPNWYEGHDADEMEGNLYYAAAMCRLQYYRRPETLPDALDIRGLAEYWKAFYNTANGSGTVEEFLKNWNRMAPRD